MHASLFFPAGCETEYVNDTTVLGKLSYTSQFTGGKQLSLSYLVDTFVLSKLEFMEMVVHN